MKYRFRLHKGFPAFSRAGYAVSVDYEDGRRFHVEAFYGNDGRAVRAEALRWAKSIREGRPIGWPRNTYLPTRFSLQGDEILN